jgi:DNA polymerase I
MGIIEAERLTLSELYKSLFNKEKYMINRLDIWKYWDENKKELINYALEDAIATYEIGNELLPLEIEISRTAKTPLFETSLSTAGQLVESALMYYAKKDNYLIPKKPNQKEIEKRLMMPIKGGFVKLPNPGIYDNIAVLDFRGLYPSIIVSYNVDPFTITDSDKNCYISPVGVKFKKEPKGLIPKVLDEIITKRAEIKKLIKKTDNNYLKARSQALKILANSFYGYLGYARSRWYSRECAESITAWGREHIQKAAKEAEKEGFEVLYIDTDSLFLLLKNKTKNDVLKFIEKFNKTLPEKMELELEDFYKRAVFVSKKSEEKGAKKKYALLSENGTIKIRGFELVRRDWSDIARDTQKIVLETILKEGNKEKAISIVKDVIEKIKKGSLPIEKFVIKTQINKNIEEYEATSPELMAAKRLKEMGRPVSKGSIISFVITKKGNSISEKAYPLELAKDYDADYYIKNQILPAVMKLLKELGVKEDEILNNLQQKSLGSYFK